MAAVDGVQRGRIPDLTVAWLIGVARHKLVDHWRPRPGTTGALAAVESDPDQATEVDDWDAQVDAVVAHDVLAALGPHHRAALTLRYLDGLPVPAVAGHLGRTIHATEALLVPRPPSLPGRVRREEPRCLTRSSPCACPTRPRPRAPSSPPASAAASRPPSASGPPIPSRPPSTRSTTMSTTETATAQVVMPYLCVHDSVAALAFYGEAFGAVETFRVVGDDGRMGHCEFTVGRGPLHDGRRVPRDRRGQPPDPRRLTGDALPRAWPTSTRPHRRGRRRRRRRWAIPRPRPTGPAPPRSSTRSATAGCWPRPSRR